MSSATSNSTAAVKKPALENEALWLGLLAIAISVATLARQIWPASADVTKVTDIIVLTVGLWVGVRCLRTVWKESTP